MLHPTDTFANPAYVAEKGPESPGLGINERRSVCDRPSDRQLQDRQRTCSGGGGGVARIGIVAMGELVAEPMSNPALPC